MKAPLILSFALLLLLGQPSAALEPQTALSAYLSPKVHQGEKYKNVFSRTVSVRIDGFDDSVRRISGTGIYEALNGSGEDLKFQSSFLYDGRPESRGITEFRDQGRVSCWEQQCSTATDASGLLYNPGLWGVPSSPLRKGSSWTIDLKAPWELGPAGKQTVTVMWVDAKEHSVMLKREGSGAGFFAHDRPQIQVTREGKTYVASVTPGEAYWSGYTVFRNGIVISDVLLVERSITLKVDGMGSFAGSERQYILLNAAPA